MVSWSNCNCFIKQPQWGKNPIETIIKLSQNVTVYSIIEVTGDGPMLHFMIKTLKDSNTKIVPIFLETHWEICLERIQGRIWDIPYPDFNVPIDTVIQGLEASLQKNLRFWSNLIIINGALSEEEVSAELLKNINAIISNKIG